ncbi:MAG: primosomal protein [Myxococcales bacterium]|nr:primosomal protein [Myxococcales bacterium]
MIARVAVFAPVDRTFDYRVPAALTVVVGARVWAPFGGRALEGVVIAVDPPDAVDDPKPLSRLVDAPPVGADLVTLAAWVAEYYCAPPGEVMRLMLPAGGAARSKRKLILTEAGRLAADGLSAALEPLSLQGLDADAKGLLSSLAAGPFKGPVPPRALRTLLERALVRTEEAVSTRAARSETLLRPATPLDDAAQAATFARARRRGEVYARIAAAGVLTLSALREADPRAGEHVRALVEAGLVSAESQALSNDPFADVATEHAIAPTLTVAQAAALAIIEPALRDAKYAPHLLHGITGSGKTEVYLQAIARALALGRTALVLVPEISLTPQLAARFRGRFGDRVAVLHSGLSDAARADAWRRIQRGQVGIALGARSAVFAPLERLGIVVVDEEHDSSFKQEEGVRYHGRDVALVRARAAGAVVLLGSATPSLETFAAARDGRMGLITLPERATARPLPPVEIVDLKQHRGVLSDVLLKALRETLAAGEQSILFLNRRGFSTFSLCKSCGEPVRCRHCAVSLTYHRGDDRLLCHYCGFSAAPSKKCAKCGAISVERTGYGTEQLQEMLAKELPGARVARLDRDTAQGDGLTRVLDSMRLRKVDVLVGTQMVTKGHDFPGVTLVGIVLADQGLNLPDFRASERTFQLLEQVAGRAGRGDRPGRVILQAFQPRADAIACARDHDYARFVDIELNSRLDPTRYPPHTRMACIRVDGADPLHVKDAAMRAAEAARRLSEKAPPEALAAVLGPAEAPLSRLKGRTRWQLFVQASSARALRALARAAAEVGGTRGVRLSIDIDPISML